MTGGYTNTTFEGAIPRRRPGPLMVGLILLLMFLAGIAFGMSL